MQQPPAEEPGAGEAAGPVPVPQALDTIIVWFRRDLRLEDNPALVAALQTALNVVGSPNGIQWPAFGHGPARCRRAGAGSVFFR